MTQAVPLTRDALTARGLSPSPAPIRIVHIGLGAFHRAHQAWFTAHCSDAESWGIAAFTGRDPAAATKLAAQDGLYCLVARDADGDRVEVITSIVAAYDGADLARLEEILADPQVAVVTLTITEAGYRLLSSGLPDKSDPQVAHDIAALSTAASNGAPLSRAQPMTALARLLAGLAARERAQAGAIAIVPCDNLPSNGDFVRRGLLALADDVSASLRTWIEEQVSFVSTSVDRITPRTEGPVASVREEGWLDQNTVVTEPFADWILSGEFPAGRPDWASAGARFVDDIRPWEQRKLWMLNGAHSILAYAGLARGHATVADAFADPACRNLVEQFWSEAMPLLATEIDGEGYTERLAKRFGNTAIRHQLSQIAEDGSTKLGVRIIAVAEQLLAQGGDAPACAAAIASWIGWLLGGGTAPDTRREELDHAMTAADPVEALLQLLSPTLAAVVPFAALVREALINHTTESETEITR